MNIIPSGMIRKDHPMVPRPGLRAQGARGHFVPGRRASRAARLLAFLVIAAFLGARPPAVRADDTQERDFIWREATAKSAAARSPDDYLAAAQTYLELANRGVRNGVLFFNLGTALLKAERYEAAAHFLRRAERYMGSSPELRRNLLLAERRGRHDDSIGLPWYRALLLWHFGLACATRSNIAIGAFTVFWLALAIGRFGLKTPTRMLAIGAATLVVLFGSSVLASLHLELLDRTHPVRLEDPAQLVDAAAVPPEDGRTP